MVYQAANKGGYYAILGHPTWLVGCFSKVDVPGSNAWLPQGSATLDVTPEKTRPAMRIGEDSGAVQL